MNATREAVEEYASQMVASAMADFKRNLRLMVLWQRFHYDPTLTPEKNGDLAYDAVVKDGWVPEAATS